MLKFRALLVFAMCVISLPAFAEDAPLSRKLTWKPPKDAGKKFTVQGYRLVYAILSKDEPCEKSRKYPYMVDLGNVTEWDLSLDPNFQPGRRYYFKIQAYNEIGESAPFDQGVCVQMAGESAPEMDNGPELDAAPGSAYSKQQALLGSFDKNALVDFVSAAVDSKLADINANSFVPEENKDSKGLPPDAAGAKTFESEKPLEANAYVNNKPETVAEMKPLANSSSENASSPEATTSSESKAAIALKDLKAEPSVENPEPSLNAEEPMVAKGAFGFGPISLAVILFGAALLIYQISQLVKISKK